MAAYNSFPTSFNNARDLALSTSGDLLISETGDLDLVYGENALLQEVLVRLRTRKGDAKYAQGMGASLDTLKGLAASDATGLAAEQLVVTALTHDALFPSESVSVLATPTSDTTIALYITCDTSQYGQADSGELLSLELTLDLQEGLLL